MILNLQKRKVYNKNKLRIINSIQNKKKRLKKKRLEYYKAQHHL